VEFQISNIPALVNGGAIAINILAANSFAVRPVVAKKTWKKSPAPVTTKLDSLGIRYSLNSTTFPTYNHFYDAFFTLLDWQLG